MILILILNNQVVCIKILWLLSFFQLHFFFRTNYWSLFKGRKLSLSHSCLVGYITTWMSWAVDVSSSKVIWPPGLVKGPVSFGRDCLLCFTRSLFLCVRPWTALSLFLLLCYRSTRRSVDCFFLLSLPLFPAFVRGV